MSVGQRSVSSRGEAEEPEERLTVFGRYVKQHKIVLSDVQLDTGLAYSTVLYARYRLVSKDVAECLASAARGAFSAKAMTKPSKRRTTKRPLKRVRKRAARVAA
jgi:pyruvate/2-oxoglutarate dehydrogenase complex dihydrolipoamide acyltransferase (E2) component